ncbi:DJ-1/PfpI family protein [Calidithermus roseus]|uniref:DJ-1/PfpI family protein n=1 Tax=Calidithermus roseus TaxID=1644118 RepID=UPI001FE76EAD|nr:DJ-1/PfpI family protein [Calidithermus roseus]
MSFDGEAATAFLHFSADYFRVLAQRYGEPIRLEVNGNRLVADLSQAPRTLAAARRLTGRRVTTTWLD